MRLSRLFLFAVMLGTNLGKAQGANGEIPSHRFEFRLGIQSFSDIRTSLRVDSERFGLGTELNLENDLALEPRISVVRTELDVRIAKRHGMKLAHYDVNRDGLRELSTEIRFGEDVYPIGVSVATDFDEELFKLSYRYRFLARRKANLDGIAGLHVTEFRASLSTIDAAQVTVHSGDAPLPVLGLSGSYQFAPRWRLSGTAEFFNIQVGDIKGHFSDVRAVVEHDTFKNGGFGMGLNRVVLDFDMHGENWNGLLALTSSAAMVYVFGGFGAIAR